MSTQSGPAPAQNRQRAGWSGNSRHTLDSSAMLGAKWWEVGDKLLCLFQRKFSTRYGDGHQFILVQPQTLNVFIDEFGSTYKKQPADDAKGQDKTVTKFSIPPIAGFEMAVQDMESNGFPGFWFGARCIIECVEIQKAEKFGHSDMPVFNISVDPR